jgi:hypothetical protein
MRPLLLAATILALPACADRNGSDGRLEAEWRGAERGAFADRATATHCAESGIVMIEAIRADSGIAMALYPADSSVIAPGTFPVLPGSTPNPPRPVVLAGLRSFDALEVKGWEGYGGTVTLDTAGGVLSGSFQLRLQVMNGSDTIAVTGQLVAVPIVRDTAGCRIRLRRSY